MIDQRTRLISIRLPESQYEHLRNLSATYGARSISSFIRWTIGQVIVNADRPFLEVLSSLSRPRMPEDLQSLDASGVTSGEHANTGDSSGDSTLTIRKLGQRIDELGRELQSLTQAMEEARAKEVDVSRSLDEAIDQCGDSDACDVSSSRDSRRLEPVPSLKPIVKFGGA